MDVLTSALILYAIVAVISGLYVLRDRLGIFPSDDNSKPVGPSYWGVYRGAPPQDKESEKVIKLNEIKSADDDQVAGSGVYAKGRAVKSAQS
jgi:hypothetical protein